MVTGAVGEVGAVRADRRSPHATHDLGRVRPRRRSPVTRPRSRLITLVGILALVFGLAPAASAAGPKAPGGPDKAVFFASDGLRQDIVAKYAAQGLMPTMGSFLKKGTRHAGNGLLTQAPPNTGAGWYTLATGAWPGVTRLDQQHVPQERRPVRRDRTTAFDPGVLQAETIAQAAERGGLKVAQIEWAGGRNAVDPGPDHRLPDASSPAAASPRTSSAPGDALFDDVPFIRAFGLQFDHPAGFAGQAPYAAGRTGTARRAGPTSRPRTARPRRCACACSTSATTSTA